MRNSYFAKYRQLPLPHALQLLAQDLKKSAEEPNFQKSLGFSSSFADLLLLIFGTEEQTETRLLSKISVFYKTY